MNYLSQSVIHVNEHLHNRLRQNSVYVKCHPTAGASTSPYVGTSVDPFLDRSVNLSVV